MNRLRALWLPATHPLTSHCTWETARQHALGVGAWGYSALGVAVAEFTMPGKWPLVGMLFLGMLVAMSIELGAGYATLPRAERKLFQWNTEIVGKLLLISLVAVSLILDGVIFASVAAFDFKNLPILGSGWPFVTCTSLLWLMVAQCAKVVEHVRTSEGPGMIPPPMEFVMRQVEAALRRMRGIDRARYQQTHPGEEPPGRWQDNLSPGQLARILAIMEEDVEAKPEPQPTQEEP